MGNFAEAIRTSDLNKELYLSFHEKLNEDELNALEKLLDEFIGDYIVSVSIKKFYTYELTKEMRFFNEMRVTGKLEKKDLRGKLNPDGYGNQYRILTNDGNYAYFSLENIIEFGTTGMGNTFKDGQSLILCIRI